MATIVKIKDFKGDGENFFDIGNQETLHKIFGGEFGVGHKFHLGEYEYIIKNIGVSGFVENADMLDTIDGEYERNTTLYFYCDTKDPRADSFQHNLESLKEDVLYFSK